MRKARNKKLLVLLPTFAVVEFCLWLVILFADLDSTTLSTCCFFSIAFAFTFAISFLKKDLGVGFLLEGLLFTLCADVFLVLPKKLTYNNQVAGMALFSLVQLFYFAYLFFKTKNKKMRLVHGIVRGAAVVIAEVAMVIVLKKNTDFLSVLSLFYIANLFVSVVFAYAQGKKELLFAIGLTLFLCCDLFVGFSAAIGTYIQVAESSLLYKIVHANFNFVWFFYLPSQVLIASFTALQGSKIEK